MTYKTLYKKLSNTSQSKERHTNSVKVIYLNISKIGVFNCYLNMWVNVLET